MTHAENVPVKMNGVDVGTARVDVDTIQITLNGPTTVGDVLLEFVEKGLVSGLSLAPIVIPALDAARRNDHDSPFTPQGGFRFSPPHNEGHNYTT